MDESRFGLPEELEEFRRLVREIVEEKIGLSRAAEIDEADEFPSDVHKLFVDNELMAVGYPEEYGGAGGGSLTFTVLVEEISRISAGCALIPFALSPGSRVAKTVYRSDTPAPVMNRFVPESRKPPSSFSYLVRMAAESLPLSGSVRQ